MSEEAAPPLPPGRRVVLPGRGAPFVRELSGPPGAPTVLLLHGWTATADLNWFGAYEPLSERFRVLSLDHRGHGRGIRSRASFRLEDCADDAAALVRALGVGPVIACGYSMGGPVASLLWRRHRELVSGLVLCATAARFVHSGPARRRLELGGQIGAAVRFVPGAVTGPLTTRVVSGMNARRRLGPWTARELLMGHGPTMLQAGGELARWDSRSWIGEVDVPAAVVVTTADELVPTAEQRWQAAELGATTHDLDGNHTVCVNAPERFARALVAACDDVARRLPSPAAGSPD